jgi:hypothetical protein
MSLRRISFSSYSHLHSDLASNLLASKLPNDHALRVLNSHFSQLCQISLYGLLLFVRGHVRPQFPKQPALPVTIFRNGFRVPLQFHVDSPLPHPPTLPTGTVLHGLGLLHICAQQTHIHVTSRKICSSHLMNACSYFGGIRYEMGRAAAYLVETLYYKPEGRRFYSRWGHWIVQLS